MEVIRVVAAALTPALLASLHACGHGASAPTAEPAVPHATALAGAPRPEQSAAAAPPGPLRPHPDAQADARAQDKARAKTRTQTGLDRVRAFAEVKEGDDETSITISDSMLFPERGAAPLPTARSALDDVARVLAMAMSADRASTVTIIALAPSKELARRRARAVKDELVARGLAAETVTEDPHGGVRDARVELHVGRTED